MSMNHLPLPGYAVPLVSSFSLLSGQWLTTPVFRETSLRSSVLGVGSAKASGEIRGDPEFKSPHRQKPKGMACMADMADRRPSGGLDKTIARVKCGPGSHSEDDPIFSTFPRKHQNQLDKSSFLLLFLPVPGLFPPTWSPPLCPTGRSASASPSGLLSAPLRPSEGSLLSDPGHGGVSREPGRPPLRADRRPQGAASELAIAALHRTVGRRRRSQ